MTASLAIPIFSVIKVLQYLQFKGVNSGYNKSWIWYKFQATDSSSVRASLEPILWHETQWLEVVWYRYLGLSSSDSKTWAYTYCGVVSCPVIELYLPTVLTRISAQMTIIWNRDSQSHSLSFSDSMSWSIFVVSDQGIIGLTILCICSMLCNLFWYFIQWQ